MNKVIKNDWVGGFFVICAFILGDILHDQIESNETRLFMLFIIIVAIVLVIVLSKRRIKDEDLNKNEQIN